MGGIVFSPNRRWALAKLEDGNELVDVATGQTALKISYPLCSFSTNGEFLAAWDSDAQASQVWKLTGDGTSPTLRKPIVAPSTTMPTYAWWNLQLHNDGKSFLLGARPTLDDATVVFTGQQEPVKWSHGNQMCGCTWSPNCQLIASGNGTGKTFLRLRSDLVNSLVIGQHGKMISRLRFSPDGTRLAVGGVDGTIDIWDVSDLQRLSECTPDEIASLLVEAQRSNPENTAAPIELADQPELQQTIKASGGIQIACLLARRHQTHLVWRWYRAALGFGSRERNVQRRGFR